ncbi:MAG: methyltransferase [Parcubacteria group bacterium]|nr:methyltransferase [Parcubacteria group bacterium]
MIKGSKKNSGDWETVRYGNITVYYIPKLDGGGRAFGQDYIPIVKKLFGKVGRLCEFGAGPGFIGFSLLAHGLCDSLCLIDINPEAIAACQKTIQTNHLENKVKTYISDVLGAIPKTEKWDLVVSNPPHFNGTITSSPDEALFIDPNWQIHKKFYESVSSYLTKNGSVLFVENLQGSKPSMFFSMINNGGLKYIKTVRHEKPLWKVIIHNIGVLLNVFKLPEIPYYIQVFQRMDIRLPGLLNIMRDPYYFMWSKKKPY